MALMYEPRTHTHIRRRRVYSAREMGRARVWNMDTRFLLDTPTTTVTEEQRRGEFGTVRRRGPRHRRGHTWSQCMGVVGLDPSSSA